MNNALQPSRIYSLYFTMIRNYLGRLVNKTDAEDLTQEVFIKVNRNINRFKGESSLKTWIFRIATNTAKDFFKSKAFREASVQTSISEKELAEYDAADNSGCPIEDAFDTGEMNKCISAFIHRLPANYSNILILSELKELNDKEVAEIAKISVGTAKVRLHRARARLKAELEKGCTISATRSDKIMCEKKQSPLAR